MGFTGQDISTAASFWAWAHGLAGATGTDGAAIASMRVVGEAIAAVAARLPITAVSLAAAVVRPVVAVEFVLAVDLLITTHRLPMLARRVPAAVMRLRHPGVAAADTRAAVAVMLAVGVVDMKVAVVDTGKFADC